MSSPLHPHQMLAFFALVAFAVLPMGASGQDIGTAPSVQARYLFFLGEFIRWPSDRAPSLDRPLTVGFVGGGKVENYFVEANQSRGGGRRIEVIRVNTTTDVRRCHIIFVNGMDGARISALLKEARRRNVVSVGESASFIRQGGMVNFAGSGGRVRTQVNLEAVRRARLEPDSRLLRSAQIVNSDGQPIAANTTSR